MHLFDEKVIRAIKTLLTQGSIELKAIKPYENIYRFYRIHLNQNLFKEVTLSTSFGRIGTHGNVKHHYYDSIESSLPDLHRILRKRLNSENRIGVGYEIILE